MLLAAGLGTRLKPLTDTKPKALIEIFGKTLLEIAILKLKNHGFTEIVINVHHFARQIIDFLNKNNNFGTKIYISNEQDKLLDTGGGIKNAAQFLYDTNAFIVYNVDILCNINLSDFFNFHLKTKSLATLAVKQRPTSRSLIFDNNNNLCAWKNNETGEEKIARLVTEKKSLAFSGIHIISSKIFELFNDDSVFSIIDTYLQLAKNFEIKAYLHDSDIWFDLGKISHIAEIQQNKKIIDII